MGLTDHEKKLLVDATDYHRKRLGITRSKMTDINQLLDELQDLVDDKRERVCVLFNRLREIALEVPSPMTLDFEPHQIPGVFQCRTQFGSYEYFKAADGRFIGDWNDLETFESRSEIQLIRDMQSHFNAAWESMTAKGAAT